MTGSTDRPDGSAWWRDGVIYQVYPRSFQDSDGDGIGDLRGIIARLDHLAGSDGSLGVDAIWLSPFYPSPMADFGYDVADYCDVDPVYGSLADFDDLVTEVHRRGIRVIVDLVPNHTSDRHPWFAEIAFQPVEPEARLVCLGGPEAGRLAAEQLALGVRRTPSGGLDARSDHRAVLPPLFPARAARPELVEPGGPRRLRRHPAVLARPGR